MFDPNLSKLGRSSLGETFYAELDWEWQDRSPCDSTIEWWSTQSQEARDALGGEDDLKEVLVGLASWIPSNAKVWGNGSTFDISMLEDAYRQHGLEIPWKFWNIRDCRTVVDMFETQRGGFGQNRKAASHNALEDAIAQAKYIMRMWRKLVFSK